MWRKYLTFGLIVLLLNLGGSTVMAADTKATKADKEAARVAKIKAGILKLGTGAAAKVKLKLHDKTKLAGYVSAANDDSFTVTTKTGTATVVPYAQVASVAGHNLTKGQKIAIGVGVAAAVVVVLAVIVVKSIKNFRLNGIGGL